MDEYLRKQLSLIEPTKNEHIRLDATDKQLGFIRYLSRKHQVPPPDGIGKDRKMASQFIDTVLDWEHFQTLDATTQEHIRRIWRNELKHEPGPWDEGFTG